MIHFGLNKINNILKRSLTCLIKHPEIVYIISIIVILITYHISPQYGLYLIRWQLSTPSLAIVSASVVSFFSKKPLTWGNKYEWAGATAANLVGGLGFYWFDKFFIFNVQ